MTLKYRHRLDYYKIRAAALSHENIEELAEWCGGTILSTKGGKSITLLVPTPIGCTNAHIGDFIYQQGSHFHALNPPVFNTNFEPI